MSATRHSSPRWPSNSVTSMMSTQTPPPPDEAGAPFGSPRREFVQAFVEHARAVPGAERPMVRPHVVVMIASISAALSLAVGAVWGLTHKADAATGANGAAFQIVEGWGCPS